MDKNVEGKYTRSYEAHAEKFRECITILEVSVHLVMHFEIGEFINVVATQLRILLCDTKGKKDNALLSKVIQYPCLYPIKDITSPSRFIDGTPKSVTHLIDFSLPPLPLAEWLNQPIIDFGGGETLSIKNLIKLIADKDGGAHVDSDLTWTQIFTSRIAETYLLLIALYVISCSGRNYEKDIKQLF